MPALQLEKSETVHSGHIYIVSFRILQILTVRSIQDLCSTLSKPSAPSLLFTSMQCSHDLYSEKKRQSQTFLSAGLHFPAS